VAEFGEMVSNIRALEESLGSGVKEPVEAELGEREWARRGVYAARPLEAGHELTAEDLICLRPLKGVPATRRKELVGRHLSHSLDAFSPIQWDDL
jgi:sialic acid synthase SpsE